MADSLDDEENSDIIVPPPVVTEIILKTATFVAKHGRAFEEKISKSGQGTKTKFQFLDPTNPYHAYYEKQIQRLIKKDEEPSAGANDSNGISSGVVATENGEKSEATAVVASDYKSENILKIEPVDMNTSNVGTKAIISLLAKIPNDRKESATSSRFEVEHPGTVSNLLVDIIKLSAQYTAIAGQDFLPPDDRSLSLLHVKSKNVGPSPYFNYFTSMVDSYTLALKPDESILDRIKRYGAIGSGAHDGMECLKECVAKYHEEKSIPILQADSDGDKSVDGLVVDWHDFVLVQTITFEDDQKEGDGSIGSKAAAMDSNARLLGDNVHIVATTEAVVNKTDGNQNVEDQDNNMTMVSDDEDDPVGMNVQSVNRNEKDQSDDAMSESDDDDNLDANQDEGGIEVVTDYRPNISGRILPSQNVIDPKSGMAVAVGNIEEHMRVELMDPKWKEEQIRAAEKRKNTNVADGSSISQNLAAFASKRQKIEKGDN
eukprot:g11868.t1